MKTYTTRETTVTKGIEVCPTPYPHITLGEGGHKRATWMALGKRDAEKLMIPTQIPCRHRGTTGPEVCLDCGTPAEKVAEWPPQVWIHPSKEGFIDGPLKVEDVGVLQLPERENQPPRYLIVAPPFSESDRILVFWSLSSGYRGSASITPGEGALMIAKDSAYHSGQGNLGESAETLAVLSPDQYLEGRISGRRIQSPEWRLTYLGEGQFEVGPFEPAVEQEEEGVMV